MLRWLRRELRSFDPEIVHAHLFHANVATAVVRPRGRARYLLTHHHGDHLLFERRWLDAILDRFAGRRFDRVVAVSNWGAGFLISRYRYPPGKVICIPNGWSGEPFAKCGLASKPTVICVARFRPQKGHADLLETFAAVKQQVPDARLLLVGDGKLGPELRSRARELGLAECVKFRGSTDNVWPHLAEAHVFALASTYEPLGIAVLEAMAAGLPVVATSVGGIPELIESETMGRLVRPGRPDEMAGVVVELLGSSRLRSRMGAAARLRAADFRISVTMERYFDVYGELLESRA
jgi:glycosyltransferase involved in cell wall biosynthesis